MKFIKITTIALLALVAIFFARFHLSPPMILAVLVVIGLTMLFRHKHRSDPWSFFYGMRSFAKAMVGFSILAGVVLVLTLGVFGIVAAAPLVGLAYAFVRYTDRKVKAAIPYTGTRWKNG